MAHVYVDSNAAGTGSGADWTNAYTTLAAALTGSAVAGNNFWVAQDHAETAGATKTLTSPGTAAAPCTVMCVNKAGTVPPVAADLATTGSITTTGTFGIVIGTGVTYWHGLIFNNGTGAGDTPFYIGFSVGTNIFSSCAFNMLATNNASRIYMGSANGNVSARFQDCSFRFSSTFQAFEVQSGQFVIQGGTVAATGSVPSTLVKPSGRPGSVIFEDVNMTNLTGVPADGGGMVELTIKNCLVNSAFTKAPSAFLRGTSVVIMNTSSADINYELSKYDYNGRHETSTIVKRTGGFSDGTVGLSQKFTTSAGASVYYPFSGLPIVAWHDSEGSNITVTVEGVADPRHFSALPTNAEFWLDLEYFGTAASPLGVVKSGGPATILTAGSAGTASTEAWDTGATARANSTVYVAGDVIKLASNSGRIFICTTGGTTDGSEPAGYASAVDGGSVTDGTATFKAGWRFKATVTTTAAPQNKGPIYVTPVMAKASSVLYLDPKLTVA